jgi:nicotinate-nucleotide pyrophosphorylase
MICLSSAEIDSLISEDLSYGDLTTRTLGFGSRFGRVRFSARGGMTVCCTEEAKLIFERLGAEATILAATGTLRLAAKAVHAGGGTMHRMGLSDSVLLFPEHRTFASPDAPLTAQSTRPRRQPTLRPAPKSS